MTNQYMNLYNILNKSTKIIKKELNLSYLEAFIYTAENLIDEGAVYNEENLITKTSEEKLKKLYSKSELSKYKPEEIRKSIQLVLLQGMKTDYIQPNHQMTPDSLGSLMAYLIEIIVEPQKIQSDKLHLVDLSVGTGNLLLTVHHFLKETTGTDVFLSGIDNDDLMLSIASSSSVLQRTPIDLQYQDSLTNLLLKPADIMISDLPVGYYPLTERIKDYQTYFDEKDEKSYSHYLLIEQAINYLKEDGYGFFLLPSTTFNDSKISILMNYLNKIGYIQGVIQLPKELFANEQSQKSILIIQKKGKDTKKVDEVLLVNAPDFKNLEGMKSFLGEVAQWKKDNK